MSTEPRPAARARLARSREAVPAMVRAADFEAALKAGIRARTDHFALHHRPAEAVPTAGPQARGCEISTTAWKTDGKPVEDSSGSGPARLLGAIVPKRHARRAVTRSLLKRQIRAAALRHAEAIGPGLWIVRLRAPFDRARFPSAASPALKRAARGELDALLGSRAASRR